MPRIQNLFLPFFLLLFYASSGQNGTVVRGAVRDAQTGEALVAASVRFDTTALNTRTDNEGRFYLRTKLKSQKIIVTYLGYEMQTVVIKPNETNELDIRLRPSDTQLQTIEIRGSRRYRNKNNPAVDIIKEAIDHRGQNRLDHLSWYNFERYDKVEFAINNITDKFRRNFLFKKVSFIFDNVDTSAATGKVNLPFYLRETLTDVYFRKAPATKKEYLRAEKSTRLPGYVDDDGISKLVENMYQKVDFYENAVNLLTVDFISPLATIGPAIYHYYIEDTTLINQIRCVHLFFSPRQKTDLAFQGDMWIALDSTYSLRKIEVQIPEQINLNWVNGLQIRQEFAPLNTAAGSALVPVRDEVLMEFGVIKDKDTKSILARRSVSYQKTDINRPLPDSLFAVLNVLQRDPKADKRDESYWIANRPDTLARREQGVYKMVDSLNRNRPFRRFMNTLRVLGDGYYSEGGFDFGPFNMYLGYNPIEGFRLRVGGRTNLKFSKQLLLEGYAARGFLDRRTKGLAGMRYSFGGPVMKYPLNQLRVWYLNDLQIPGQPDLQNGLVQSVGRGDNNRMLYNRNATAEYLREFKNGFSWSASFKHSMLSPAGVLEFNHLSPDGTAQQSHIFNTEAGLTLRYAPNEKFYQSADYRVQIFTRHPIFTLRYSAGLRGVLGGQYNYHAVHFRISKGFYVSPLGWSEAYAEAGRLFGQVSYPLLTVHQGNQTYLYQRESYNLMNFLEFVSDRYAAVNITHNFGGFFFNRLPLVRRLKLREIVTFKALWGGLDAQNRPSLENGLLLFPTDAQGRTLTYTLEKQPYVEASVGISNIFKFLRIDLVRRFNYLDHPGVAPVAIRGKFQMEF